MNDLLAEFQPFPQIRDNRSKVEISAHLAKRMRSYRKKNNVTRQELGKMCSCSEVHLQCIENRTRMPGAHLVSRLATVLGVTADQMLGTQTLYTREEQNLMIRYRRVSQESKSKVRILINEILTAENR